MRVHLIAIGQRMPGWVAEGFEAYRKRLGRELPFVLRELPAVARSKGQDAARAIDEEGDRLLGAVPAGAVVVLLDERGTAWSTRNLAEQVAQWRQGGRDVALLAGGADGVSANVRRAAQKVWSLSALTLPHPLVRIVVIEQLYRAVTLLSGHPYHRD
ncbi:MAG TPA: 23S rRNA (pseudouridine(1915)-N(3))-methyltransferase RlmH [Xanthomonadaceae bacterium]|nr:23S rRNA (pseudouridine(1915)-N(3))-methyltransferase RlmH [Xanthomonadaceae bacterium]